MHSIKYQADQLLRRMSRTYQVRRKYESELSYWRTELVHLEEWFVRGTRDWWGLRPPREDQKCRISELWVMNAIATRNVLRPSYLEKLKLEADCFTGKRVLEVGSGPTAPILQFTNCERHCVDPLVNVYMEAGWPLFAYDAKFINTGGESLPYPDEYFDAVISVNALDHVEDFERVAAEMQRVLKRGGGTYFETEYHTPTVTEPIRLNDARVIGAFSKCDLKMVLDRTGREVFEALMKRFDLQPFDYYHFDAERFCTWHGIRR